MADEPMNLVEVLQRQCEYWQGVLGLQDWHIHVYPVPANHPKLNDGIGSCEYFQHRRDAIIRVMRPADLPGSSHSFLCGEEGDYDLTLVHEMLHIHFAPFAESDQTPTGVAQEQAVNAISKGIVGLYRETQGVAVERHGHKRPEGVVLPDVVEQATPPADTPPVSVPHTGFYI